MLTYTCSTPSRAASRPGPVQFASGEGVVWTVHTAGVGADVGVGVGVGVDEGVAVGVAAAVGVDAAGAAGAADAEGVLQPARHNKAAAAAAVAAATRGGRRWGAIIPGIYAKR